MGSVNGVRAVIFGAANCAEYYGSDPIYAANCISDPDYCGVSPIARQIVAVSATWFSV